MTPCLKPGPRYCPLYVCFPFLGSFLAIACLPGLGLSSVFLHLFGSSSSSSLSSLSCPLFLPLCGSSPLEPPAPPPTTHHQCHHCHLHLHLHLNLQHHHQYRHCCCYHLQLASFLVYYDHCWSFYQESSFLQRTCLAAQCPHCQNCLHPCRFLAGVPFSHVSSGNWLLTPASGP